MSEHSEQAALIEWAQWQLNQGHYAELALLFAIPNGEWRSPSVALRLQEEGVKPGVPDLFLPVARGGWHGLFIELKIKDGRVRPEQKEWQAALLLEGYRACVCWGWEEARDELIRYLGGNIPCPERRP